MVKKWIQKALRKHRKGALSKQLGIPEEDNIPFNLLTEIQNKPVGEYVTVPPSGIRYYPMKIKVTRLLKKRANLALNLKRLNK
jgi:hypothetical protein